MAHGIDVVLLLTGNRSAQVTQGTLIWCDDLVKSVHKQFSQVAYVHGLKWPCENCEEVPSTLQKLLNATINGSVDELKHEIKLHKLIANSNNLPIPPCKCIVPKPISSWNMRKSRSDTTTKMLEMCLACLPVSSAQSEAIARFLMKVNCNTTRECHVVSSEGKEHFSLEAHKNASKQRNSHKDSMFDTFMLLLQKLSSHDNNNLQSTPLEGDTLAQERWAV